MNRSRIFALALVLAPLVLWTTRAEDPPPEEPKKPPAELRPLDQAWEWQMKVICDWPELPAFDAGGAKAPAKGKPAAVVVLAAGKDPSDALRHAAGIARRHEGFAAHWVAPDAETAKFAAEAKIEGVTGGVAPEIDTLVPVPVRPALLLVGADGRIRFSHFPGAHWDPELWAVEARELVRETKPNPPPPDVPAPTPKYQGALACAACHRDYFKDWLMTPHSTALHELRVIGRDEDPKCIGCHVAGWEKGGFADRATHRHLADVQCEACHVPEKIHSTTAPMGSKDYPAQCAACHKAGFSFFQDFSSAMGYIAHSQAKGAGIIPFSARQSYIDKIKREMYLETCASSEYVGTDSCTSCHEKPHAQWATTRHAKAFETLVKAGKEGDPKCQKCHTTGHGLTGGFTSAEKTPDRRDVGCESCHGPGGRHVAAKTPEEYRTSIFRFDENCPTCVVQRICRSCHDADNDPDFDLFPALQRVRHRQK